MGVGEASINLIADHWVNFSYLEKPSFPKCCECGGMWRKSVSKDKGVVSLKHRLVLRDNLYGIDWELQWWWWGLYADDCFSVEKHTFGVFVFYIYDILIIANSDAVCVEVSSWSLMSPSDCLLVFWFPLVFSGSLLLIRISFAVKSKHIQAYIPHF